MVVVAVVMELVVMRDFYRLHSNSMDWDTVSVVKRRRGALFVSRGHIQCVHMSANNAVDRFSAA